MSFLTALKERIALQFGPGHFQEDDYSFLQPGGNDHLVQFLFKCFPDEYWDLPEWDRHHLLLIDLAADADSQFSLDDNGHFGVLQTRAGKGKGGVQAVIDLRDELLALVYYFGDVRKCSRFNRRISQSPVLHPCYIDSEILFRMVDVFEKVFGIQYDFEQSPSLFLQPVIMKGELQGELVQQVFTRYSETFSHYLNLTAISGFITDGAQGSITLQADGTVRTNACRLSSFIEIVSYLFDMLHKRYLSLVREHLIRWEENADTRIAELVGLPIQIDLPFAIERMDGLIRCLTGGGRDALFSGTAERVSRKLWSIKAADLNSAEQIELEVSSRLLRVLIQSRRAIPLYDRVEHFIRRQVCAVLDHWNN